jgi:NADH-quinone oxidoreductase subunit H
VIYTQLSSHFILNSLLFILQSFGILLFVLLFTSLLTVLERKGLAASQRRLGPSYHGWWGLLQIVADGVKLILKENSLKGYLRSSSTVSIYPFFYYCWIPIWLFVFSYLVFLVWWLDFSYQLNIPFILFVILFIQGVGHLAVLFTGVFTSSRWSLLGALRSVYLYLSFDLLVLLNWIILLPTLPSPITFIEDQFTLGQLHESQLYWWNIFKYPIIVLTFTFALLVEASRIPADLSESESELVSGYNTEFGGFAYALLASSEYAVMLFASIMYVLFLLGGGTIGILYIKVTVVFSFMILVRATLPRVRFLDLFTYVFEYYLPVTFFVMLLFLIAL